MRATEKAENGNYGVLPRHERLLILQHSEGENYNSRGHYSRTRISPKNERRRAGLVDAENYIWRASTVLFVVHLRDNQFLN